MSWALHHTLAVYKTLGRGANTFRKQAHDIVNGFNLADWKVSNSTDVHYVEHDTARHLLRTGAYANILDAVPPDATKTTVDVVSTDGAGHRSRTSMGTLDAVRRLWACLAKSWQDLNDPSVNPATFEANLGSMRAMALALKWRQTPWVHVWLCHLGQMVAEVGYLKPYMQYGFEARHKKDYPAIENSTHSTVNPRTQLNGYAECVAADHADAELVRLGLPRPI